MANRKQNNRPGNVAPTPGAVSMVPVQVISQHGNEFGPAIQVSLDVQGASPPAAKFAADAYWLPCLGGEQRLVFAQSRLDGKGYRAVLDIRVPLSAMEGITKLFAAFPAVGTPDVQSQITEEPEEAVSLYANAVRAAQGDGGNCIDFFLVSPFGFKAKEPAPTEIAVEPVVRVMMSPGVNAGIVSYMKGFKAP